MKSKFLINLNINKTFETFFEREDIKNELFEIEKKIGGSTFYPMENEVLRFANNNLSNVKCIILGMDPYPSNVIINEKLLPVATGRSFEVRGFNSWLQNFKESSLQNILKAIYVNENKDINSKITLSLIREKITNKEFKILPPNLLWDDLEKQGVMWLNAILTVKPNASGSHIIYWKYFVNELLKYIVKYKKDNKEENCKWLIWGTKAKERILGLVDEKDIIYSCHPSSRMNNDFVEKNCFQYIKNIIWTGIKKDTL